MWVTAKIKGFSKSILMKNTFKAMLEESQEELLKALKGKITKKKIKNLEYAGFSHSEITLILRKKE